MATFKIDKKHGFKFEYIVDGKKHTETIYIDMTDRNLSKRMMKVQDILNERMKDIKVDDIQFKSEGLPQRIDTLEDIANLSDEQISDIKNISDTVSKLYDDTEQILIEEIGKALGADITPAFKYCHAFDVINEEYYISLFIESLADEMVKYLKEHPQQEVKFDKKPYMRKYLK